MTPEYTEDTTQVNEHYKVADRELHIAGESDDVEVWLNTLVEDFDGICVGGGESRVEAVTDAIETLEGALRILRERL